MLKTNFVPQRKHFVSIIKISQLGCGENSRLRTVVAAESEAVTEEWRKLQSEVLYYSDQIMKGEMGWACGRNRWRRVNTQSFGRET